MSHNTHPHFHDFFGSLTAHQHPRIKWRRQPCWEGFDGGSDRPLQSTPGLELGTGDSGDFEVIHAVIHPPYIILLYSETLF